jgi:plasmid stabilization system protein ParE
LTSYPKMGMVNDHHRGFRRLTTGSHIAFYQVVDDAVPIVRVLHGRQEPELHLP